VKGEVFWKNRFLKNFIIFITGGFDRRNRDEMMRWDRMG
jgi:hypothetical protein